MASTKPREDGYSNMLNQKKIIWLGALCLAVGSVASIVAITREAEANCIALDERKIRSSAVEYYLSNYKVGNVSVQDEDGKYKDYPYLSYQNVSDYLSQYPDCCHYNPGKYDGRSLLFIERVVEGKCGFVSMAVHTRYKKEDGSIGVTTPSSRVWIVDKNYQIYEYFRDR
ncbi:hypothetical protein ABVF61_31090 [Roseibium sp. HPY-6]|uniref:hypothetical protein n=1 Tax=Roseibium sp. HPY-6 TaxID=3229852 RepID=UPI00338E9DA1